MAGKTKLGTYQYEIEIDGKKAVIELKSLETKVGETAKKVGGLGKAIGDNFQNWIKSGLGFNALLGGVRENLMKMFNAINEGIKRAAANNAEAKKSFELLGKTFENIFTNIGKSLLPLLTKLSNVLIQLSNYTGIGKGGATIPQSQIGNLQSKLTQGIITQQQYEDAVFALPISETKKEINKTLADINKKAKEYSEIEFAYGKDMSKRRETLEFELGALRAKLPILRAEEAEIQRINTLYNNRQKTIISNTRLPGRLRGFEGMGAGIEGSALREGAGQTGRISSLEGMGGGISGGDISKATAGLEAFGATIKAIGEVAQETSNILEGISDELVKGDANPGKILSDTTKSLFELIPGMKEFNSGMESLDKSFQKLLNWEQERAKYLDEQARKLKELRQEMIAAYGTAVSSGSQNRISELDYLVKLGRVSEQDRRSELNTIFSQQLANLRKAQSGLAFKSNEWYSLELTALSIEEKRLELNKELTDEMQAQSDALKSQLQTLIQGGLIDVENIATAARINTELTGAGVTGMARFEALSSLGVKGNIGQVNIEVNEASGNTVEDAVSARLLNIFGGK